MYVLAEPDYENELSIVRLNDIKIGHGVTYPRTDIEPRPVLGVDLALFGKNGDDTVIYAGWTKPVTVNVIDDNDNECERVQFITKLRFIDNITTNDIGKLDQARWVIKHAIALNAYEVRFDIAGVGADFEEHLLFAINELDISKYPTIGSIGFVAMRGQGNLIDSDTYLNDKTAWFGNMRSRLAAAEIDLDPDDKRLQRELLTVKYSLDAFNRMKVKSKREMTKSPDYADAAVFCCIKDTTMARLGGIIPDDGAVIANENDELLGAYELFSDDPFNAYFPIDMEFISANE